MPPLLRRLTRVVRIALRREPPAGASERRLASVLGGTLAGIGARAFTSLVSLVSLPLCVRYLGQERYGAWATLWSLLA